MMRCCAQHLLVLCLLSPGAARRAAECPLYTDSFPANNFNRIVGGEDSR